MFGKRIVAAVIAAGVLGAVAAGTLLTGHPVAAAATGAGAVAQTTGKVTALQSNGFSLQAPNQTFNVTVDSNTWIVVKDTHKPAQGTLANIKVGDQVRVAGTSDTAGHLNARLVVDGVSGWLGRYQKFAGTPAGAAHHRRAAGLTPLGGQSAVVQSVANGTLTLATKQGNKTVQVNTDAGTIVIKGGLAAVSDLKAGDRVDVVGRAVPHTAGTPRPATPATRTAELIYVPSTTDHIALGAVKSVTGTALTVRTFSGQQTATLTASTVYESVSAAGQPPVPASAGQVQAGSRVVVYGPQPTTGKTVTASLVLILPKASK